MTQHRLEIRAQNQCGAIPSVRIHDRDPSVAPRSGDEAEPLLGRAQELAQADAAIASAQQKANVYSALISAGMDPAEAKRIAKL